MTSNINYRPVSYPDGYGVWVIIFEEIVLEIYETNDDQKRNQKHVSASLLSPMG